MEGNNFKEIKEIVKMVLARYIYQDNLECKDQQPINVINEKKCQDFIN